MTERNSAAANREAARYALPAAIAAVDRAQKALKEFRPRPEGRSYGTAAALDQALYPTLEDILQGMGAMEEAQTGLNPDPENPPELPEQP